MEALDPIKIAKDDDDSDTSQEDFEEGESEFPYRNWMRPPLPSSPTPTAVGLDIEFMVMDCDFGILPTRKINPKILPLLDSELQKVDVEQSYVRLHGVKSGGHSICCNVFNFLPYFYIIPISTCDFMESEIPRLKELLSSALKRKMLLERKSVAYHGLLTSSDPILSIEVLDQSNGTQIFDLVQLSQPSTPNSTILKVTCRVPKFVWAASKILKEGEIKMEVEEAGAGGYWKFELYEASINHTIRFLTDMNIPGCSWVKVHFGDYCIRPTEEKLSHAQLEFDVTYQVITKKSSEPSIPPLRILSYDLEIMTRPPHFDFPRNGLEQILQIGNVVGVYCAGESAPNNLAKVIFTLKSCDEIPDTEVYSFDTEEEMLAHWRLFLLTFDPDIITGYNIKNFDFPYVLQRASRLNCKSPVPFLGRLKRVPSKLRPIKNMSKAFNRLDTLNMNLNGRVIVDMLFLTMHHFGVTAYSRTKGGGFTLREVAKRFLGQEKEDVGYMDIFPLQEGGPDTRKRMATYCIQDALLPYSLMMLHQFPSRENPTFDLLEYYIQRARETGLPLRYLFTKSLAYQTYYRRVRLEKNPGIVCNTPGKKRSIEQILPKTPPRPAKTFSFSQKCNFATSPSMQ